MSVYDDLTYGRNANRGHDDQLRQVDSLLPDWLSDDSTPMGGVVKLIWLDQQADLDSPNNIIVMAPGFGMWVPMYVEVVDEELVKLMRHESESDAAEARIKEIMASGYKIRFTLPADEDGTKSEAAYPDWVKDEVRTVRILTDEKSLQYPPIFTTTPEGQLIRL